MWKLCQQILDQQYGLPSEAAAESATNFLRAFRARPDDDSFAIDEWPAHLKYICRMVKIKISLFVSNA
ncbi:hypothetical protein MSG28_006994 [Choristoneura fumiferana]|uniref:Uncharacterized protein n=1 Tax=Choristoneura fumiferana TaxID=7141 RepID=A0ACC0JM40_CHOFU|nr:hypothetical protein MSG28_006994 [Choristoneura fumiferana]